MISHLRHVQASFRKYRIEQLLHRFNHSHSINRCFSFHKAGFVTRLDSKDSVLNQRPEQINVSAILFQQIKQTRKIMR